MTKIELTIFNLYGVECGTRYKEISSTYHYCPWCGELVKWE